MIVLCESNAGGVSRMAETAVLLVDDFLPHKPIRQWVLSFPFPIRFLLANNRFVMTLQTIPSWEDEDGL